MKKKRSPCRWTLAIVVIGVVLYFSRSFWPLFFQGKPYAEIEATIPPDMILRVGATYRSSSCTEMTFSDFSQIRGRKGWSKEYIPDSQGRVTAKVYQYGAGPCNWLLNGFSISTEYDKVSTAILSVPSLSENVKKEMIQQFSSVGDIGHRTARFNLNLDYQSSESNEVGNVALNTTLTPSIMKIIATDDSIYYEFGYEQKRSPDNFDEMKDLNPYGRKETIKIRYDVDVNNHILFKEFHPLNGKDTSKIIQ